jgi:hypothetical protein
MTFDEVAGRIPDIVTLDSHGVRLSGVRHGLQRGVEVDTPRGRSGSSERSRKGIFQNLIPVGEGHTAYEASTIANWRNLLVSSRSSVLRWMRSVAPSGSLRK